MRLPLVVILTLLSALACTCASGPDFNVTASSADGLCASASVCVRVRCTVHNTGRSAPAVVTLNLYQPDGSAVTATEYRILPADGSEEVSHDFELAEPTQGAPRYSCHVDPAREG